MTSELFDWAERNSLTLFPCNPADKKPIGSWTQWQTQKTTRVQWEVWTKQGYILAVLSSEKLGLLDIDDLALAQALFDLNKIVKSGGVVVTTPGGGVHIYFLGDQPIPAATWKLRRTDGSTSLTHKSDELTLRGVSRDGKPSGYLIAPRQKNAAGKEYALWPGCTWDSKPLPTEGGENFIRAFERRLAAQIGKTIFALDTNVTHDIAELWRGAKAGDRHHSLLILYSALRRAGTEEGERKKILLKWNKRNTPPKSDREILDVIRDLDGREVYNFGLTEPPREAIKKISEQAGITDEKQNGGQKLIAVKSYQDFVSQKFPPQIWAVSQFIQEGGIVVLAGKPGTHKTTLALRFALSVGTGQPFLTEEWPAQKGKVLFLNEDMSERQLQYRTIDIAKSMGITNAEISFASYEGVRVEHLDALLTEHKPKLVVFDAWRRLFVGEENDATEVNGFFQAIRKLIKSHGAAWLFLHHLRKEPPMRVNDGDPLDALRGSGELSSNADSILVTRKAQGGMVILSQVKCRDAEPIQPKLLSFTWTGDGLQVSLEGDADSAIALAEQASKDVIKWFTESETTKATTKQIKDVLQGRYKPRQVEAALKLLKDRGVTIGKRGEHELAPSGLEAFK